MGTMVVAKPFTLTRNDGTRVSYGFGVHEDVPDADASHPYAQHFLAPNGRLPEPSAVSPLTHEERVAMKAALDAAEDRVSAAEKRVADLDAEAQSSMGEIADARQRAEKAEAEVATLRAKVTAMEADLDKATKPVAPAPKPAAAPAK